MSVRPRRIVRLCRRHASTASLLFGALACTAPDGGASGATSESTQAAARTPAPESTALRAPGTGEPIDAQQVVLAVEGMSCESCERTIAVMLRRTPGVRSAKVSVARGEAVVSFDSTRTTPAALVTTIERLGYRARVRGV